MESTQSNMTMTYVGEDQRQLTEDLAAASPGRVVSIDQDLYEEVGGPWNHGDDPIGEAHGSVVVTEGQQGMCHITFKVFNVGTIVAHGSLPVAGSTVGSGTLAVAGGTGKFDKALGKVDVEHRNPKRWSFAL
jgi:hypothetical protein